jgi:hypothetical protein
MTAKMRNLNRVFPQEYKSNFKNLLVSGGSYVWNNSEKHICTWPYYLKDISGFTEVYDCSQVATGVTHVFNSVINEIETNKNFDAKDTLIIVMLNDFAINDTIATQDIAKPWLRQQGQTYDFNDKFSSLTLFPHFRNDSTPDNANSSLGKVCIEYAKHIDMDAKIYENLIRLKALRAYLHEKKFNYILLTWKKSHLSEVNDCVVQIETLDDWTERHQMRIPNDGHPTPDAHLAWTREILIPYLNKKDFIEIL